MFCFREGNNIKKKKTKNQNKKETYLLKMKHIILLYFFTIFMQDLFLNIYKYKHITYPN